MEDERIAAEDIHRSLQNPGYGVPMSLLEQAEVHDILEAASPERGKNMDDW